MKDLNIKTIPSLNLCIPCKKVKYFSNNLKEFCRQMNEVMIQKDGIGIAAPQVGFNLSVLILDKNINKYEKNIFTNAKVDEQYYIIINPTITDHSKNQVSLIDTGEECLSVPGQFAGKVNRYEWITVEYSNLDGQSFVEQIHGFSSTVVQHEMDHLFGIMYPARMKAREREVLLSKYSIKNNISKKDIDKFISIMMNSILNPKTLDNIEDIKVFCEENSIEEGVSQAIIENINLIEGNK